MPDCSAPACGVASQPWQSIEAYQEEKSMSKKGKSAKRVKAEQVISPGPESPAEQTEGEPQSKPAKRMSERVYLKELEKLEAELVHLQTWVIEKGLKVVILFEGRDGAGKGGTIKAITGRVSPRVFRVVALPAPTEREKTQMYVQRYLPHMPAAGEVVIFDRSWYNRAGVERVMGFASDEQVQGFLKLAPLFEKLVVGKANNIILLKYWLEVDMDEQTRRLEARITDPRKQWKLSPIGPQVVQPLVRLLARARRNVQGDRHRVGALVRRPLRRQETRTPEHHQAYSEQHPVRDRQAAKDRPAQAPESRRLSGSRSAPEVYSGSLLSLRSGGFLTRPNPCS
jgi:polyphosphate kinase 2